MINVVVVDDKCIIVKNTFYFAYTSNIYSFCDESTLSMCIYSVNHINKFSCMYVKEYSVFSLMEVMFIFP